LLKELINRQFFKYWVFSNTMIIIVCGLIGSGKTTVAKRITKKINGTLLRTDVIRSKIYPNPKYTNKEIQDVYKRLFNQARNLLSTHEVILDATFYKKENREQARNLAREMSTELKIIEVIFPNEKIAKERIEARTEDESDADFQQYLINKPRFEPITEDKIVIDNSGSLKETYEQVDKYF